MILYDIDVAEKLPWNLSGRSGEERKNPCISQDHKPSKIFYIIPHIGLNPEGNAKIHDDASRIRFITE